VEFLIPALLLLVGGILLMIMANRRRAQAGLPPGRVVYADTGAWRALSKPLFDSTTGLTGKPDYVVETPEGMIPVEVKSAYAPAQPYYSHRLQLAAYCLLLQRTTGQRPAHGILKYRNRAFEVPYTAELEQDVLRILTEMRQVERRGSAGRSHEDPARCQHCGYRSTCDERLD